MTTIATPSPYTATQTQLREIAMALFNVDLRREAVKNAQSVGTALAERVNKAAWKTYLPALIDLLVNVLRDPATEYKDRLASILGENKVTVNDLIAIMAAAKSQIAQYGRDSESMGGFLVALCADVEMDDDALFIAECGQQAASLATRVPGVSSAGYGVMNMDGNLQLVGEGGVLYSTPEEYAEHAEKTAAQDRADLRQLVAAMAKLPKKDQRAIINTLAHAVTRVAFTEPLDYGSPVYNIEFRKTAIKVLRAAGASADLVRAYTASLEASQGSTDV